MHAEFSFGNTKRKGKPGRPMHRWSIILKFI
jgi:hypothetical protein